MKLLIYRYFPLAALLLAIPFVCLDSRSQSPRRIEVSATRFAFNPSEISLKKGEPVVMVLKSTDVAHGLRFRELGIDVKAGKGRTAELPFTPTRTGDFVGQCSVFCGSGHGNMRLTLHVVE